MVGVLPCTGLGYVGERDVVAPDVAGGAGTIRCERFDNVMFLYMPLELAMKNAEQDEPGFFENM